jgi:hypothetical protein
MINEKDEIVILLNYTCQLLLMYSDYNKQRVIHNINERVQLENNNIVLKRQKNDNSSEPQKKTKR